MTLRDSNTHPRSPHIERLHQRIRDERRSKQEWHDKYSNTRIQIRAIRIHIVAAYTAGVELDAVDIVARLNQILGEPI